MVTLYGVGDDGVVIGVAAVPEGAAIEPNGGSLRESVIGGGERAPFWLSVITLRLCIAVVALSLPSGRAVSRSAGMSDIAASCRKPS